MNVKKMAEQDAAKWARAEMFFGDGAGIRRKHLTALIDQRIAQIPGYQEKFERAYNLQDMADHAIKAAKERQRIDRLAGANKNLRALKSGNMRGLSNGVLLALSLYYVAKTTGYDKKIEADIKQAYSRLKAKYGEKN